MNIGNVSFRSTVGATPSSTFSNLVRKPQAYAETPAAATTITQKPKKKSVLKKALIAVGAAAAAVAGIALGAKKGVFTVKESTPKFLKGILPKLETFGNSVSKFVSGIGERVKGIFNRGGAEVAEVFEG